MPYSIDLSNSVQRSVRAAARERLDLALGLLASLGVDGDDVETVVHDVRKRCKEVRGLARLVRDPLGREHERFNALVREAALTLAPIRDAHAVLATLDDLRFARNRQHDAVLNAVRARQADAAHAATHEVRSGDERIGRARELLETARKRVRNWHIDDGTAWLERGLDDGYRRARRRFRDARVDPTDEHLHEWRKSVKTLWYELRLIEACAPSVLGPMVVSLHDLAEALGDDHDLTVLVEQLEASPKRYGGRKVVKAAVRQARAEQDDLRRRAFRLGATLLGEPPRAFVERVLRYWTTAVELGPELPTGGIAELVADELGTEQHVAPAESGRTVERERKFIVDTVPELAEHGRELRQGYLAIDGTVSVRVRAGGAGGASLTVKAGRGAVRTELELSIADEQFEAAWPRTAARRVHKTRYRVDLTPFQQDGAGAIAEIDVFHGALEGLVVAEVEFADDAAMAAFMPPAWFGREVTDDPAFTNASLAVHGCPPL